MKYSNLKPLRDKIFFTVEDIASLLSIKPSSARVFCSRYVRHGLFVRIKNNCYVFEDKLSGLSMDDLLKIANLLQVPSYISLITALSYYELTTQVQRGIVECVCTRHSSVYIIPSTEICFYKLKKEYYNSFSKVRNIFIATKEKALIDCIYLSSLGKYSCDFHSIDYDRFDKKKLKGIIKNYPMQKLKDKVKELCKI